MQWLVLGPLIIVGLADLFIFCLLPALERESPGVGWGCGAVMVGINGALIGLLARGLNEQGLGNIIWGITVIAIIFCLVMARVSVWLSEEDFKNFK